MRQEEVKLSPEQMQLRSAAVGVCTAASPDHFSYRRDGVTGRQAMVVVRTP